MNGLQLTKKKALELIGNMESERIERTVSMTDTDKYAQVICAYSNDLSNSGMNGYLLIGVDDDGKSSGLKATDKFLQALGGLRSDGNILPQPLMSVETFSFKDGDVVVIEIKPSPFPPVRYRGRTWIRVGPRKAVASEMEERILTEKRTSNISTFDIRPSLGNDIDALDINLFDNDYIANAIDKDILENDERPVREKLASLRFYSQNFNSVTNAALALFGKNIEMHLPGAYIQYVKFDGLTNADEPVNEKKFNDNLSKLLPELDTFLEFAIIKQKPVPVTVLREEPQFNYPKWALRELLMNAIMHRDYESNAPVKFYQYSDRIEIVNPGGLYGAARPENFPTVNDYRNPVIAEAMKVLGYVNRFNRGIARVEKELRDNGNPKPLFVYDKIGVFEVTVFSSFLDTVEKSGEKTKVKTEEKTKVKTKVKILDLINNNPNITVPELVEATGLSLSGIEYNIRLLKAEGLLERVGPDKGGHWSVTGNDKKS